VNGMSKQQRASKALIIAGNVFLAAALLSLVVLMINCVVLWHNYPAIKDMTSFPLTAEIELTAIIYMMWTVPLVIIGVVLRVIGAKRVRPPRA